MLDFNHMDACLPKHTVCGHVIARMEVVVGCTSSSCISFRLYKLYVTLDLVALASCYINFGCIDGRGLVI